MVVAVGTKDLTNRVIDHMKSVGPNDVVTRESLSKDLEVGYQNVSFAVRKLVSHGILIERPINIHRSGRQTRQLVLGTQTPVTVSSSSIPNLGLAHSNGSNHLARADKQANTYQIFSASVLRDPQVVVLPDYSVRIACIALVNYPADMGGERIEPILINSKYELPRIGGEIKVIYYRNIFDRDAKRGECEQDMCVWQPDI